MLTVGITCVACFQVCGSVTAPRAKYVLSSNPTFFTISVNANELCRQNTLL